MGEVLLGGREKPGEQSGQGWSVVREGGEPAMRAVSPRDDPQKNAHRAR